MKNRIINLTPAITNMSKALLKIAGEQPVYYRTKKFVSMVKENEDMLLKLMLYGIFRDTQLFIMMTMQQLHIDQE